ncbi:tRNA pseudouridine(13) synthase TruD [Guyparkeria hydrothermalis]|uniref:tRNA pseudouridine(13) synthase TruD n=1 Tax=Guyparkeria hydrothermalis TaxID=923 RepID=UPI002021BFA6|nr:tRNA pseudouridine(13) synthase TruD [Guyparkeria hydrothermalis]MCL7744014.1 tRNA pseudouridine(13) synthase TruD [Guyparkeria hydrothermalis]
MSDSEAAPAPRDWLGAPGTVRPRVCGQPQWRAGLKASPESFRVDEELGFEPSGAGNHWLVRLEKRDMTTGALVDWAGKATGTRARDIGFSGLKDRFAVTTQWLSFPHETFDPEGFKAQCDEAGIGVLALDRHDRKLRRGTHRANRFRLVLNDVSPVTDAQASTERLSSYLDERVGLLAERGMANYFGEQRYGRGYSNLRGLVEWGTGERVGKPKRSVRNWLISTLRSAIFDHVLAARLDEGTLDRVLPGDLLQLAGSRSRFLAESDELDALQQRLEEGDVVPTGPLWGEQGSQAGDGVAQSESTRAAEMIDRLGGEAWVNWFAARRVASDRRPLAVRVTDLDYRIDESRLTLEFSLPPGSYATELVAELFAPLEAGEESGD